MKLLEAEKELTHRSDELAKQRRELPWVPIEKQYTLLTEDGPKTLRELLDGRSQLVVYLFMFGPDYKSGCPACSATADSFNDILAHLSAHDVTMICVSRAPIDKLLAYRKRMRWNFNWASSYESDFNFDYSVSTKGDMKHDSAAVGKANELQLLKMLNEQSSFRENPPLVPIRYASTSGTNINNYLSEGHGFNTFALEDNKVYHCYSTYTRGTEFLMVYYAILDCTPKGRDEDNKTMIWLRRHDEY